MNKSTIIYKVNCRVNLSKRSILLLSCITVLVSSCGLFGAADPELKKKPYIGNQLRVDGYYYNDFYQKENGKTYRNVYFFYKDGTLLNGHSQDVKDYNEEVFKTAQWISKIKESKTNWNTFEIQNDSIHYNLWGVKSNAMSWSLNNYNGKILNDTTFITENNQTYKFKQFSSKPDSTNRYIK